MTDKLQAAGKPRYDALDLMKAVGIFLVVFHHNNYSVPDLTVGGFANLGSYWLRSVISLDVVLFFFASGAVLLNKPLNLKRHGRKTLKLAGLTLLWAALTMIVSPLLRGDSFGTIPSVLSHVWNWDTNSLNHFWFLQQMVVLYLLFPLLKSAYDHNRPAFLFFLGVACLFSFGNSFLSMGRNVIRVVLLRRQPEIADYPFFNRFNFLTPIKGFSVAYLMLGGLLWEKREQLNKPRLRRLAAGVLLLSTLLHTSYGLVVSHCTGTTYDLMWPGHDSPFVLIGVLCVFVLCLGLPENGNGPVRRLAVLIGRNTMGLYFLHVIFGGNLARYYRQIPGCALLPVNLLYVLLLTLLSLGVTLLLRKIPWIRNLLGT